jgi:hypothetical protein
MNLITFNFMFFLLHYYIFFVLLVSLSSTRTNLFLSVGLLTFRLFPSFRILFPCCSIFTKLLCKNRQINCLNYCPCRPTILYSDKCFTYVLLSGFDEVFACLHGVFRQVVG